MADAMEIRMQQKSDLAALRTLYYDVRKEEFPWVRADTLALEDFDRATSGESVLVAVAGACVIGFLSVWEPDGFIHNLFVSRGFRGRHAGRSLVKEAARLFGTPLTLKCVKENQRALGFYLSNGWTVQNEGTGDEGPYYLLSLGQ